ncbi:MAG: VWA domain-containing protein [Myxococcota bacterium]
MIRFSAPWLLFLVVPVALYLAYRLRRLPKEHHGVRRRVIQGSMFLAALFAGLALAGLEGGREVDRLATVFVLDRSRSVERAGDAATDTAIAAIRDAIDTMRVDDKAGLVVFGGDATTEIVPSPTPPVGTSRASVPRDASDLAAGIRRALADLPAEHAGRIVLISDGVETQGDVLAAAASARSRGVVIDVLPVERAPRPEIAVERVRVPTTANPGEPVEVRVVTRATHETEVRVRVSRNGETIADAETTIARDNDVLVLRDIAPDAGVHRYDVTIEPIDAARDASRANNQGGSFMRVAGESRVLILSDELDGVEALRAAVARSGLEVETGDVRSIPVDLATAASYDLIVLADMNARQFTEAQMRMLASYVRDLGGGLLMAGARDSFGLGGYAYSPIEEVLPATFDLRQRRDRASLAMVIGIDNSGSMGAPVSGGRTKLDLANEAAARSASLLSPMDRAGVIHVDTAASWTLPMSSVSDPARVSAAVRRAQPGGGGILVDVAMETAYGALRHENTQLKHFLLFSDGSDSQGMGGMRNVVQQAVNNHITTSIVSMGNGPDTPELEALSRIGNGRFYIVEDLSQLPRIFTQETIEASRSAVVQEAFVARADLPGAATRGIDFASSPALGGYVVMNARPTATRLLLAKDSDPLLLQWQHGVGRSATFATDVGVNMGKAWLSWPGYEMLFGQLARDIARSPERRDAQISVTIRDGVGYVRVEAVDEGGRYRNYLDLRGSVAGPGGRRIDVDLDQTGAGRYEGTFDAQAPGPYLVTLLEMDGGMLGSAGIVRPPGNELQGQGTDHATLAQVAALTGGEVRPNLTEVFADRPPETFAYDPLWPLLVAAAMLLLLLSVGLRRLALPERWYASLVPAPLRRILKVRPPVRRGKDPEATMAALQRTRAERKAQAKAAPIAKEIAQAQRQTGSEPAPMDAPAGPPVDDAKKKAPTEKPATLAEQLLARRKKK